ncbi:DUF2269 domain-containing protein [Amycolatopsis antarctica]|uniref:DUF2269 domain-containing protein n=1 Tax=Amycolatopsis antarctica TaxID=1854586 RepID=A0A263CXB4_9PSEU|nr:DUF2269 domain-containing protein [Amycolatopsis antarctica]OZM70782.1 DUF2269 domain-containing protein [Amycolatopsis antarctica]
MAPRVRKAMLMTHVASSVGWLGAVVAYLVLAIIGVASSDVVQVRGAYSVMEPLVWCVLVPMSLVSLASGLVSALGSLWGLLRHYWVVFKLAINLMATVVLLLYATSIGHYTDLAAAPSATVLVELRNPTHVVHAGGGLVLLVLALMLSIYKPRGRTGAGRRDAALARPRR